MDQAAEQLVRSLGFVLPEIVLVATACVHFLAGPFLVSDVGEAPPGLRHRWGGLALVGLLTAAAVWLGQRPHDTAPALLTPFKHDELAWFVRGISFAAGLVLLLMSWNQVEDRWAAEHHACLLLIVAGVNLIAAANDLVGLFLALELVSIPTYLLLYLARHDEPAREAVLKYFLLSIFSSAVLLYGLSFLYGVTGTTNLAAIHAALAAAPGAMPAVLLLALAAVIAGLAFRITAVPFHFYAPDVFAGTATTGAAMLAFVPKIAGFVALIRLLITPQPIAGAVAPLWSLASAAEPVLWALAAVSMLVGNVMALQQTDVRRLLAWSSIAHAGYMLVGLAAGPGTRGGVGGVDALLFYLVAYGAMTVGMFAVLVALGRSDRPIESSSDLGGLSQTHPAAALLLLVFLFSLTGMPPTAGFLGKLNLFLAAWSTGEPAMRVLAVLLAINAAVGAWYYLRLIGLMYLQPSHGLPTRPLDLSALAGSGLCAAATLGLFAAPNWLWQFLQHLNV